jgi:serine/threonine protein kinase
MSTFERDDLWAWVQGEEDDPDRAAAIAEAVASDPALAEEVAEMRALIEGIEDAAAHRDEPAMPAGIPETIGSYRVVRRLGAGGMGVVFEAEQQHPKRRVALKVIRGAAQYDPVTVGLFQREVQALAQLEHPSIAQIFEAGQTDEGTHFLVMELISGLPLDAYALGDSGQVMDLHSRLQLMLLICRAITHAHQRGVIHRDLKPANILITREGQPKILDFGLARLAEADQPANLSQAGQVLGTLAYMSPEQAKGERDRIDVRSDVYALGVILYELVTGVLPHDVSEGSFLQIVNRIANDPVAAPSSHNRRLPHEIDAIVLKALAPELERRYASAAELADDLERYLTNFPVRARRPSAVYHLNLFVRRNRTAVALLTLLFVSITGAAIGLGILSGQYLHQRDRAISAAEKYAEMNLLLLGLIKAPNAWESGSADKRVSDVLGEASARIEREVSDLRVAIELHETLADTYRATSQLEAARHERELVLKKQRGMRPPAKRQIARSLVELGDLCYESGDVEAAKGYISEALMELETLAALPDALHAQALNLRGVIARREGALQRADELFLAALTQRQTLAAESLSRPDSENARLAHNAVAQTINNRAGVAMDRADAALAVGDRVAAEAAWQAASQMYAEALALRERWLAANHPEIAKMCNNLSLVLARQGAIGEAERYLRRALEILQASVGSEHLFAARAHYNLARLLRDMGRVDEARAQARRAFAIQEQKLSAEHPQRRETEILLSELEVSVE